MRAFATSYYLTVKRRVAVDHLPDRELGQHSLSAGRRHAPRSGSSSSNWLA